MNESKEALICMMKYLNDWFSSKIKNIKFDRTLTGTIIDTLTDGYMVNISGQNHKIKSSNLSLSTMTQVHVKIPCHNWNQAYIESVPSFDNPKIVSSINELYKLSGNDSQTSLNELITRLNTLEDNDVKLSQDVAELKTTMGTNISDIAELIGGNA